MKKIMTASRLCDVLLNSLVNTNIFKNGSVQTFSLHIERRLVKFIWEWCEGTVHFDVLLQHIPTGAYESHEERESNQSRVQDLPTIK
jgi:hypothetical protein